MKAAKDISLSEKQGSVYLINEDEDEPDGEEGIIQVVGIGWVVGDPRDAVEDVVFHPIGLEGDQAGIGED